MKINVVTAIGKAKTKLGAFDSALIGAGIANTNIICLSSVIPPHAEIVFDKPEIDPADFGKRLYVVMARRDTDKIGKIAAGVGWVMEKNGRFGLFVEHDSTSKARVKKLITKTLTGMIASRSDYEFTDIQYAITETTNKAKQASCALAVAVYETEDWRN